MMEVFAVINCKHFPQGDVIVLFIQIDGSVFYLVTSRKHLKKLTRKALLRTSLKTINSIPLHCSLNRNELVELIKQEGDLLYSYNV